MSQRRDSIFVASTGPARIAGGDCRIDAARAGVAAGASYGLDVHSMTIAAVGGVRVLANLFGAVDYRAAGFL